MKSSLCGHCKARPKKKHFNSKWCEPCSEELKLRPKSTLTPAQIRKAKSLLFKMPREEIAREIGTSVSNLKRWARDAGGIRLAYFNRWASNPKLVNQVCEYYAKHGKSKTVERFPGVNLRSIVETYGTSLRQVRWTNSELIELARMAGIVSIPAQANWFDRPNANSGSIKSAWMKRFRTNGGDVNGLSWNIARKIVVDESAVQPIAVAFWAARHSRTRSWHGRRVVLWAELPGALRDDIPEHLKEAIAVLAKFQEWLHGTKQVREAVESIIKEREINHGKATGSSEARGRRRFRHKEDRDHAS